MMACHYITLRKCSAVTARSGKFGQEHHPIDAAALALADFWLVLKALGQAALNGRWLEDSSHRINSDMPPIAGVDDSLVGQSEATCLDLP